MTSSTPYDTFVSVINLEDLKLLKEAVDKRLEKLETQKKIDDLDQAVEAKIKTNNQAVEAKRKAKDNHFEDLINSPNDEWNLDGTGAQNCVHHLTVFPKEDMWTPVMFRDPEGWGFSHYECKVCKTRKNLEGSTADQLP